MTPRSPRRVLRAAALLAAALAASPAAALDDAARPGPESAALAALGAEIAGLEARLADARAALRAVAQERAAAQAALGAGRGEAFATLAALDRIGRAPPLAFFAHPAGPTGAARAAMVVEAATPALAARGAALGAAADAFDRLAALGGAAADRLRAALASLQAARAGLQDRLSAAERRALLSAARAGAATAPEDLRTLDALLAAFGGAAAERAGPPPSGGVPPAVGALSRRFVDTGAGVEVLVAPHALVRAPLTATLRHVGQTRGRGLTAVLEPQAGRLVALSGLGRVDRAPGEVLAAGEPLGAMGGPPPAADEFLIDASVTSGTIQDQMLYIEVREDGVSVDPARWFPPAASLR